MKKNQNENLIDVVLVAAAAGAAAAAAILAADKALKSEKGQAAVATVKTKATAAKETVKVKAEEVKTNVQAKAAEVKVKAEEVKDKVKGKLNKNACGCTCEETAEETERSKRLRSDFAQRSLFRYADRKLRGIAG